MIEIASLSAGDIALFGASITAGAVASVSGFGIGSILVPVLGAQTGTGLAVIIVSAPHFAATALRFLMLRRHVDRRVLLHFGLLSALGAFAGALLHHRAGNLLLSVVFASLLIFVGLLGLTGPISKVRFHGPTAWAAGALSGFLGGLVGNQGGIRSGALLGFPLSRDAFVGTATAVGLIVDAVRMPVYFLLNPQVFPEHGRLIAVTTAGVLAGTIAGAGVLKRIPQNRYRQAISVLLLCLGISMLVRL